MDYGSLWVHHLQRVDSGGKAKVRKNSKEKEGEVGDIRINIMYSKFFQLT